MKFFILIFSILFSLSSFAGNDGGSGGDAYGNEFESLGKELRKTLDDNPAHEGLIKWNLSPELFTEAIGMTVLRSAEGEDVKLNGEEVDAINGLNGEDVIKINRTRWRQFTLFKKLKNVLHEYFGILKIEKNKYNASDDFADIVRKTHLRIRQEFSDLDIDLFYGYQRATAPVQSSEICDSSSLLFQSASKLAVNEAISRCLMENKNCAIKYIENNAIISTQFIGLKYCEITAIAQKSIPAKK